MSTPLEALKAAEELNLTVGTELDDIKADVITVGERLKKVRAALEAPPAPPKPKVIVGVNDGSGWGPAPAKQIIAAGLKSERLEGTTKLAESKANGFSSHAVIVGNTPDTSPLSSVNVGAWVTNTIAEVLAAQAAGALVCEVINEPNLKGGVANPAQYGKMYAALHEAKVAMGLTIPLAFYTAGDWYNAATKTWEQDASMKGWNEAAITAVPALKTAIDCICAHPYGKAHATGGGDAGPGGLENQLKESVQAGVVNADKLYITEWGEIATGTGAPELATHAAAVEAAYVEFLGMPQTRGIWYYQSHDDSNGRFGLIDNTTGVARPAFAVVAGLAQKASA